MTMLINRREAERDAKSEPLLSSFLYASILAHDSFARAVAFVLANRLANATLLPTQLFEIFSEVLNSDSEALECALSDVAAVVERVRGGYGCNSCLSTCQIHVLCHCGLVEPKLVCSPSLRSP